MKTYILDCDKIDAGDAKNIKNYNVVITFLCLKVGLKLADTLEKEKFETMGIHDVLLRQNRIQRNRKYITDYRDNLDEPDNTVKQLIIDKCNLCIGRLDVLTKKLDKVYEDACVITRHNKDYVSIDTYEYGVHCNKTINVEQITMETKAAVTELSSGFETASICFQVLIYIIVLVAFCVKASFNVAALIVIACILVACIMWYLRYFTKTKVVIADRQATSLLILEEIMGLDTRIRDKHIIYITEALLKRCHAAEVIAVEVESLAEDINLFKSIDSSDKQKNEELLIYVRDSIDVINDMAREKLGIRLDTRKYK